MRAFANDIAGEANIDSASSRTSNASRTKFPEAPRQVELFRLGHAEVAFAAYAEAVNANGHPLWLRYHALVIHFDRTMRQSPLWREFMRNAAQQPLTAQWLTLLCRAVAVATALRDEEALAFADPAFRKRWRAWQSCCARPAIFLIRTLSWEG
jgi:hypothetical protein